MIDEQIDTLSSLEDNKDIRHKIIVQSLKGIFSVCVLNKQNEIYDEIAEFKYLSAAQVYLTLI